MGDDKRSHEAFSLRSLFNDQLHYLQELIENFGSQPQEEALTDEDKRIIEGFVDAANIKLRAAHDYADKLRDSVRALYSHVLQVAEDIPSPISLSQDAFRTDPLINSLFVNTEEVDRLFSTNRELTAYFRIHSQCQVPVVYALLTACKSEKSILGLGMLGDMLVRDVAQQTVNFSLHKLHMPCDSSAALAAAVKKYLFDRVVALIKQEMASRIAAERFHAENRSYESQLKSLANPDVYLNTLIEYVAIPAKLLRIDKTHFRLNKLGIKLADDDRQCANEFDINELTWSDSSQNVILRIAYTR